MEAVIVTIRTADRRFERDMELPCNLPVETLGDKLLETLKLLNYGAFGAKHSLSLRVNGRPLDGARSLDEQRVWDGAIITIQ